MKTFTCREIMNNEGGCDKEFTGDDMMAGANAKEDQAKWFEWFKGVWDAKA